MPFEFVIQFHRRVEPGAATGGTGPVTMERGPSSRPLGLELFLSENRIDFGGIMQALFSNMDQALSMNRPTAKSVIDNLPKVEKFTGDPASMCPVCLETFENTEEAVTQLECKHFFHLECIKPWLAEHNTCPTCRLEMKTEELTEDSNPFRPHIRHAAEPAPTIGGPVIEGERGLLDRVIQFPTLLSHREPSSISEQDRTATTTSPALALRSSARPQRSNRVRDTNMSSSSTPIRRQPPRGTKRSARQQSQSRTGGAAEESSTATATEEANSIAEATTGRRTRRRHNPESASSSSSSSPQLLRATTVPRNGLTLLSYVAASAGPSSQAGHQAGTNRSSNFVASIGDPSTRMPAGGGSRGPSLFPFSASASSRFHVLPLPALTDADMEDPIRALLDSVSASTRTANTTTSSSSSSSQSQSRTSSQAMHYTRTSSGRSEAGSEARQARSEDADSEASGFVPSFAQRLQSSLQGAAEEANGDARPGPYRRRNVQVRMRRFRVGRVASAAASSQSAPVLQTDSTAPERPDV